MFVFIVHIVYLIVVDVLLFGHVSYLFFEYYIILSNKKYELSLKGKEFALVHLKVLLAC